MNLTPKKRSLPVRILFVLGLGCFLIWKVLHLPTWFLPRAFRAIIDNWTYGMFRVAMGSLVTRVYVDQPCRFKQPASYAPQAEVAEEYRLDESTIRQFNEDGFIGPFDAFTGEQMQTFRRRLVEIGETKSETYGFVTPRDRHLEEPELMELMRHPAITERVAQLLGPNLLCWRSQIFYKMAGTPKIQWHQASTFLVEDYLAPALFPKDRDSLFQLTIWVAVDPATRDNGCVEFIRGGHERMRTARFGGDEGFYRASYTLDFDEQNSEVVPMEVKQGQFIIFTERCIHGSRANDSPNDRLAFNFRVVPPNMKIYPGRRYYRSVYNGGKYFLDKWGTVLLRGEDPYRLSRSIPVETLLPVSQEKNRAA